MTTPAPTFVSIHNLARWSLVRGGLVPWGALSIALSAASACGGTDEVLAPRDGAGGELLDDRAVNSPGSDEASEAHAAGDEQLGEQQVAPAELAEPGDPVVQAERDEQVALALQEARTQWAEQGASDYSVKVRRVCFCAPRIQDHVLVNVARGQVVSAFGQGESGQYEVPIAVPSMEDWYTVPGMFGRIEMNLGSADRIDVVFDEQRGFPSELALDYRLVSSEEGEFFEMWDFVPAATEQ